MTIAVGGSRMAKKMGRPTTGRDDASARIDKGLLFQAKQVAGNRGVSVAEYLSELLKGPVERDYAELLKKLKL